MSYDDRPLPQVHTMDRTKTFWLFGLIPVWRYTESIDLFEDPMYTARQAPGPMEEDV